MTTAVQTEISQVIDNTKTELHTGCSFFDRMKERYQEVMNHINSASKMGTTKSAMFEDVDNMLRRFRRLSGSIWGSRVGSMCLA